MKPSRSSPTRRPLTASLLVGTSLALLAAVGSAAPPANQPTPAMPAMPATPAAPATAATVPVPSVTAPAVQGKRALLCPLKTVRAEIVSKLPEGWWQTPQEGGLEGARIEVIGGQPTLVCEYQAYGTRVGIMHVLTDAVKHKCVADKLGALCW